MNDWRLTLKAVEEMARAADRNLSIVERAGLYGGATELLAKLERWIRETAHDAYALEKIGNTRWHIGAALGLDIDNGKTAHDHRVWALGELSSLKNQISGIPALSDEE